MREVNELTETVIGCAYRVSNALGSGFLEKVYENALSIEIRKAGLAIEQQHPIRVRYLGEIVGEFACDLFVEGTLIVELKAVKALDEIHLAQCLNYLKATGAPLCLLLNFGRPRLEIRRVIATWKEDGTTDEHR